MKIIKLIFLCMGLCALTIEAMEMPLEKEKQLVDGSLSEYEYLRFIESNPTIWGIYSTMVRELRVADYSHYDEDLYELLLDELEEMKTSLQSYRFSDRNLRLLKERLKRIINDFYNEMRQAKTQRTIRESKIT